MTPRFWILFFLHLKTTRHRPGTHNIIRCPTRLPQPRCFRHSPAWFLLFFEDLVVHSHENQSQAKHFGGRFGCSNANNLESGAHSVSSPRCRDVDVFSISNDSLVTRHARPFLISSVGSPNTIQMLAGIMNIDSRMQTTTSARPKREARLMRPLLTSYDIVSWSVSKAQRLLFLKFKKQVLIPTGDEWCEYPWESCLFVRSAQLVVECKVFLGLRKRIPCYTTICDNMSLSLLWQWKWGWGGYDDDVGVSPIANMHLPSCSKLYRPQQPHPWPMKKTKRQHKPPRCWTTIQQWHCWRHLDEIWNYS